MTCLTASVPPPTRFRERTFLVASTNRSLLRPVVPIEGIAGRDFYVIKHIFENFPSKIWREFSFRCTFAAQSTNDVSHRRLSVGYPLDNDSGIFYARTSR